MEADRSVSTKDDFTTAGSIQSHANTETFHRSNSNPIQFQSNANSGHICQSATNPGPNIPTTHLSVPVIINWISNGLAVHRQALAHGTPILCLSVNNPVTDMGTRLLLGLTEVS